MIYALIVFHTDTVRNYRSYISWLHSLGQESTFSNCALIVQSVVNVQVNQVEEQKF